MALYLLSKAPCAFLFIFVINRLTAYPIHKLLILTWEDIRIYFGFPCIESLIHGWITLRMAHVT